MNFNMDLNMNFNIILLIVLILILCFLSFFYFSVKEGFITFQESTNTGISVIIPQYNATSNVTKLYDNLFFSI